MIHLASPLTYTVYAWSGHRKYARTDAETATNFQQSSLSGDDV